MDGRKTTSINLNHLLLLPSSNKRRVRRRGKKRRKGKNGGDLPRSGIDVVGDLGVKGNNFSPWGVEGIALGERRKIWDLLEP